MYEYETAQWAIAVPGGRVRKSQGIARHDALTGGVSVTVGWDRVQSWRGLAAQPADPNH